MFCLFFANCLFAQHSASQILRTQELFENEKQLRKRLEENRKFIKQIVVQGSTVLLDNQLDKITASFQRRWLDKRDIQRLIDLIKSAYDELGLIDRIEDVLYRIKGKRLLIEIEEVTPQLK